MTPIPAPYGWLGAAVILGATILCELLPVAFGTGEHAKVDWSFAYVTLHFVLLPVAAIVHIVTNLGALALRRSRPLRLRLADAASTAVSIGYLVLLIVYPLPFSELIR